MSSSKADLKANLKAVFGTLPRTQRGAPLVLGPDPKNESFLYAHGNTVVIRSLVTPETESDLYTHHSCPVLVAKFSPSRFYIASADKSGKVRIWDTVNAEHILKNEFQPICGPIKDLSWSNDNQRIVTVGEGREKFGHVFLSETGTSNGDITGQTRPVNSCDFRPARPFRILTGSEDNTSAVYEGPPFKFKGTKTEHSRYVQAVRYSPDGLFWASAGFDGKIFLYEGKDSTLIGEFLEEDGKNAHGGGVYALAWSPDGRQLLSASGDKSCRIWDVSTRKMVCQFVMGTSIDDQQLGCLWSGEYLISISLSGQINYLDPKNPGAPSKVVQGHNKPITCIEKSSDGKNIYTGDSEGRIIKWDTSNGHCQRITGNGHESQINSISSINDSMLFSLGIDDTYRIFKDGAFQSGSELKLSGQPKAGFHHKDFDVVVTVTGSVVFIAGGKIQKEEKMSYEPTSVAMNGNHLAIGDTDAKIHIYAVTDDHTLNEVKELALNGPVTHLSYSPDEKYLVASDGNRKVTLYDASYNKANNKEWVFHTAKVNCVAWSPNSRLVASGGLDCCVIIWSVDNPSKHLIIASAHTQSQITGIKWLDDSTVISTGQDSNIKTWDIKF